MFRNYMRIALKVFSRQRINSVVNILGLSISLACCLLVFLYVSNELSYDKFHKKGDRLYSVVRKTTLARRSSLGRGVRYTLRESIKNNFPEVEESVGFFRRDELVAGYNNNYVKETPVFTDKEFFTMFSFKLILGDPSTVFNNTNNIVLSQNTAEKYFGNENPLGKSISLSSNDKMMEFTVTGIIEDPPKNSSIEYEMLIDNKNVKFFFGERIYTYSRWGVYLLLKPETDIANLNAKISEFAQQFYAENIARMISTGRAKEGVIPFDLSVQNMKDIHSDTTIYSHLDINDMSNSYILSGIALILIIVACINYINMFNGSSTNRVVEIGVRKIIGAGKKEMAIQFISEAVLFALIAFLVSLIFVSMLLPSFNQIFGKQLSLMGLFDLNVVVFLFGLILFIGIISGSFPAYVLARLQPIDILSKKFKLKGKNVFSKLLIIFQFSISIFLLITTLIMGKQITHMRFHDLGFERDSMLLINSYESDPDRSDDLVKLFKSRISTQPSVLNVSGTLSTFNTRLSYGGSPNLPFNTYCNRVYYDFIETSGLKLVDGRDFSRAFPNDTLSAIVNNKFVSMLDVENPLGHVFEAGLWGRIDFKIIGVIEDYNFSALSEEIQPVYLHMSKRMSLNYILLKISGENIPNTLGIIENTWKEVSPNKPFTYSFLNDHVDSAYREYIRWKKIVNFSAIITLIITLIGIFCLTSLSASRRIKEIGIRKVLGASVSQVNGILTKDLLYLIVVANIVAIPIAWYFINSWLQDFAYRINIDGWIFFLCGLSTIILVLSTVSYHTIIAAIANPIDSLRDD